MSRRTWRALPFWWCKQPCSSILFRVRVGLQRHSRAVWEGNHCLLEMCSCISLAAGPTFFLVCAPGPEQLLPAQAGVVPARFPDDPFVAASLVATPHAINANISSCLQATSSKCWPLDTLTFLSARPFFFLLCLSVSPSPNCHPTSLPVPPSPWCTPLPGAFLSRPVYQHA